MNASRVRLIWLITGAGATIATSLFVLLVKGLPGPGHHLPLLLVVAMFAISEVAVVHVEVGSETHRYSLVEVPLVLGLLALQPWELVVAWLVGGTITLGVVRRQSPVKLAYNVTGFALQSVVAILIFRAISNRRDLLDGRTLVGVFAATAVASLLSIAAVFVAVALTEGRQPRAERVRYLWFGLLSSGVTASTMLVGVVLQQTDPSSLWLLALPIAGVYLAARAFASQNREHRHLERSRPEARLLERQLVPRATYDPLTGLANRSLLAGHLARLLGEPGQPGVACLFIDLDDFRGINDRFGHSTGDQLLVVTAQRLVGCLRDGDLAARLGGDELAVVAHVDPENSLGEANALGQRIVTSLSRPASIGDETVRSSASVGIALGRPGESAADLLAAADGAMYAAKAAGKGRVEIFAPGSRGSARRSMTGGRPIP